MSEICSNCGLPNELCVCETIAKETQSVEIKLVKKKFGKVYTQIHGVGDKQIDIKELTKKLKSQFACGGTVKKGVIELQGDHSQRVKKYLGDMGFPTEFEGF